MAAGEREDLGLKGTHPGEVGSERRTFQIHACLGRGGFGEVYRATMESSGGVTSEVAIKVLRADINPGSDSVKRLRDEGRLLGKLSHPAIVKVHDLVILDGRVSLVTEFVDGQDLDQCFKGTEPMPARPLVTAIGEVASALQAAWDSPSHTTGEPLRLIHRDVKPANIRIGKHGEVKLLDFGIARAGNTVREAQTAANAMMGSYLYMAPERFHEDAIQPPSDIFALGSVLYEGLSGERFFGGMTLQQVYAFMLSPSRYKRRLEERLSELALDVPVAVLDLVRAMMAADPEDRPTADEVQRRCEDVAEVLAGPSLKRWARDRNWPLASDIHGSLDGRVLSAGTVGTAEPPPLRGTGSPVMTSGRIPNAPPVPQGLPTPQYSPPPQNETPPPPQPQMLGAGPGNTGSGPALPSQPAHASYSGEPGLGDFSLARSDAAQSGPAFVFGGPDDETQEYEPEPTSRGGGGIWTLILVMGLVALMVVGAVGVGAFFFLPGMVEAPKPIEDVPLVDGTDDGADAGTDDGTDAGTDDGTDGTDGTGDGGEGDGDGAPDDGTPEPEPTPEPAPAEPEPAPAPKGPTAASLSNQGWNSMGNPAEALALFDQAIGLDASYGEAHYGRGYALVKLDRKDEGKTSLCQAKGMVDTRTAGEIDGFLQGNELSCD